MEDKKLSLEEIEALFVPKSVIDETQGILWVPALCSLCESSHTGPCLLDAVSAMTVIHPVPVPTLPVIANLTGLFKTIQMVFAFKSHLDGLAQARKSLIEAAQLLWVKQCSIADKLATEFSYEIHKLEEQAVDCKRFRSLFHRIRETHQATEMPSEIGSEVVGTLLGDLFGAVTAQASVRSCTLCRKISTDPFCPSCVPQINKLITQEKSNKRNKTNLK